MQRSDTPKHRTAERRPHLTPKLNGSPNRYVNGNGDRADPTTSGDDPVAVNISMPLVAPGLAWSPRDDRFALSSRDLGLRIISRADTTYVEHAVDSSVRPRATAWAGDGSVLFVVQNDHDGERERGALIILNPDGTELSRHHIPAGVDTIAVHPDCRQLALGYGERWNDRPGYVGGLFLHDRAGKRLRVISHKLMPHHVAFDPTGELLAVEVFSPGSSVVLTDLKGHTFKVSAACPRSVWIGPREVAVQIRTVLARARIGKRLAEEAVDMFPIDVDRTNIGVVVSADRRMVAVLNTSPSCIDVYDVADGTHLRRIPISKREGFTFALASDGRVSFAIEGKRVVHIVESRSRSALIVRSELSVAGNRKVARREAARKQTPTLAAGGSERSETARPLEETERERLEILRKIQASELAKVVRTALVPSGLPGGSAPFVARRRANPPRCPSCKKPMSCIVALGLDNLPGDVPLAGRGIVEVFYCTNPRTTCDDVTEAWSAGIGRSKLVRIAPASKRRAPSSVAWKPVQEVPGLEDLQLSIDKASQALKRAKLTEDDWPTCLGGDKIGGHPRWVQSANYPPCPSCQKPMMELVLQLESGGIADVSFGGDGTAYVFRCRAHPRKLDLIWQC